MGVTDPVEVEVRENQASLVAPVVEEVTDLAAE